MPFCLRKCPYCDFYSVTDLSLRAAFIEALIREMEMAGDPHFHFDTLYMGGGTPSVFDAEDIGRITERVRQMFRPAPDIEVSLEVNPGTATPEKLRNYSGAGVNRLSIGVQSFQDANLSFLGRIHSGKDAMLALQWARAAGFENIGIDLICGIPGQTRKSWLSDLQNAVEWEPAHISCYTLTYERGTAMDDQRQKGEIYPLPEGRAADMFELTTDFLEQQAYQQYEISNFARSGAERSRHNQKYWNHVPYLGFGPSAHSFDGGFYRSWNYYSVDKYIQIVREGKPPTEKKEHLTREQHLTEAVYLGLRKTAGINLREFREKFGSDFYGLFGEKAELLQKEGFVRMEQDRFALTRKGMLFFDSIAAMLI